MRSVCLWQCLALIFALAPGCSSEEPSTGDGTVPDLSTAAESGAPPDGKKRDVHDIDGPDPTPDGPAGGNTVVTGKGSVRGKLNAKSRAFLGIPYAAPPSGGQRWKEPQPHQAWSKPLDVLKFGPSCPQLKSGSTKLDDNVSEDCLTLNVWTPYPAPAKQAPVMVWIHGGAFLNGGSSIAYYSGQNITEKSGVVVVSINYRLGALGFLAHPSLGSGSGNYGLQDQQAALGWVQKNIAAFGGDPNNVTVFGESAGGISICLHLVSPGSKGLFHRAIMESGACLERVTHVEAEAQGKKLAKAVGCDTAKDVAACLRLKTAAKVLNALPLAEGAIFGDGAGWGPNIDGKTLPGQPNALVKAGTFNKVPVLLGSNKDEGTIFVVAAGMRFITKAQYIVQVNKLFGSNAAAVLKVYPAAAFSSPGAALSALVGDAIFSCPTRQTVRAVSAAGQKAYLYHFMVKASFSALPFLGVFHGSEIPFVFHNYLTKNGSFTPAEDALSDKIMGYWTRFARTGSPNTTGQVQWPAYTKAADKHLQIDQTFTSGSGLKSKKCDLWESVPM